MEEGREGKSGGDQYTGAAVGQEIMEQHKEKWDWARDREGGSDWKIREGGYRVIRKAPAPLLPEIRSRGNSSEYVAGQPAILGPHFRLTLESERISYKWEVGCSAPKAQRAEGRHYTDCFNSHKVLCLSRHFGWESDW